MRRSIRRWRSKKGQSLVEFTLCLPVLLLIVLCTIDVSRLFFDYIQMRQAVVEGTTYGQRHPFDSGGIVAATQGHGIPGDAVVTTSADGACAVPGQTGRVQVTATKTFTPLSSSTLNALVPRVGGWSFDLSATSTMRCFT